MTPRTTGPQAAENEKFQSQFQRLLALSTTGSMKLLRIRREGLTTLLTPQLDLLARAFTSETTGMRRVAVILHLIITVIESASGRGTEIEREIVIGTMSIGEKIVKVTGGEVIEEMITRTGRLRDEGGPGSRLSMISLL